MKARTCACGRKAPKGEWQCEKCALPASRTGRIQLAIVAFLVLVLSACAENWTYDIKSLHHDEKTGRHYVTCKSEYSETYIQVDVTPEVYQLLKIDSTCPAPMSVSPALPTTSPQGDR